MRRRAVGGGAGAGAGGQRAESLADSSSEESQTTEPSMAARERTAEFAAAARSLRGGAPLPPRRGLRSDAPALATYAHFMSSARLVSKNVSGTYSKLEKLALRKLCFAFLSVLCHIFSNQFFQSTIYMKLSSHFV